MASGNEIGHQLHVLQTLLLNVLEVPMNRPIDPNDADALDKIKELRRIAFDSDGTGSGGGGGGGNDSTPIKDVATRKPISPRDYRKLGFRDDTTPLNDFGSFYICILYYFAARWRYCSLSAFPAARWRWSYSPREKFKNYLNFPQFLIC